MLVLKQDCLNCHKPGKSKGGLLMNARDSLLKGGDSGPALVPGQAEQSLLYKLVLEQRDPHHMPPKKQLPAASLNALRDWINAGAEWRQSVLDQLEIAPDLSLATTPVSTAPALALAVSPDHKKLAASAGGQLLVYDLQHVAHPLVWQVAAHPDFIQALAWSNDGQWLATAGYQSIKIWSVAEQRQIKQLHSGLASFITALCFTKDGHTLYAADGQATQSGHLHQIHSFRAEILHTWKAHEDSIYQLLLTPDGGTLISGSADKLIKLWSVKDQKLQGSCEGHTGQITALAYHPQKAWLASAGADREIKVWDMQQRQQLMSLGDKKQVTTTLTWTTDTQALITGTEKGRVICFSELKANAGTQSVQAAKEIPLAQLEQSLHAMALNADSSWIALATAQGKVEYMNQQGEARGSLTR
jgi:WD40 repeat protein